MKKLSAFLIVLFVVCSSLQKSAQALPFNDDMVNSPVTTGAIMRPLPDGTASDNISSYKLENREEALKLTNPIKGDKLSTLNGRRLFQVNCTPCHGDIEAKPYVPGPVAKFLPGPDLTAPMYHDKADGRSDGNIYATIHFGSLSTLMPRVGWKLSPTEHWDIINYVRSVQNKVSQPEEN